jgi:hypothetical protein
MDLAETLKFWWIFVIVLCVENLKHTKKMKNKIQLMLLLLLGASQVFAQNTIGTDFWFTIMPNAEDFSGSGSYYVRAPEFRVTGERPCSGTVSNPHTGWSETFEVVEGQATIIPIPVEQSYALDSSDCILETGIHVETTDSVSVFVGNYTKASFDVYCALPMSSLGSDYLVQTYDAIGNDDDIRALLSVIAVEDNTTVDFLLSCDTKHGHFANDPFSVTLQEGECYQLQAANNQCFNGSRVSVRNRKQNVAVLAGNRYLYVPNDSITCADQGEEQMMPTSTLGRMFVIVQTKGRVTDYVRVTALKGPCEIRKDGVLLGVVGANQYLDFCITSNEQASFLETSEPAIVGLYSMGSINEGNKGDPSMVIINPLEQQVESATFCTFRTTFSRHHFVNIVTETDKVSGMMLDTADISSQFNIVTGNPEYSYARIQLEDDESYHLSNSDGGFLAQVYGYGYAEAYSFWAGSSVLTSELTVNGASELEHPEGFISDVDEMLNFKLIISYELAEACWDFGDGSTTTTTGHVVQHSYAIRGDYRVSCDLYRQGHQGQQVFAGRVSTIIHVGTASLEESVDEMFSFYPNPGQNTFNIRTAATAWQPYNAHVEIYDLSGRLVHSQSLEGEVTEIDVAAWPEGVYVWTVVANGKEAESGKWIKQ